MKITTHQFIRGLIYLSGIITTGLGVNILLRSALGAGAWDTVLYNMRAFLEVRLNVFVTLGTISFVIYGIVLASVMFYHKKLKFLIVLIPIFGIALAIDFWDIIVFGDYYPSLLWIKIIFFLLGIFTLTLGLSLIIVTKYPAMVFDELTLIINKVLRLNSFFKARILVELFAIILATILGFLSYIGFGSVNIGSLLLAFLIGPMIELHLKYLDKLVKPLMK